MNRVKSLTVQTCLVMTRNLRFAQAVAKMLDDSDPRVRDACDRGEFWAALIERQFPRLLIQRQDIDIADYRLWAEELAAEELGHDVPVYSMKLDSTTMAKASDPVLIEAKKLNAPAYNVPFEYMHIPIKGLTPLPGSRGYIVVYRYSINGDELEDENIAYITNIDGDLNQLFNSMMNQLGQRIFEDINSLVDDQEIMDGLLEDGVINASSILISGLIDALPVSISIDDFSISSDLLIGHLSTKILNDNLNGPSDFMVSVGSSDNYVQIIIYQVTF